MEVETMEDGGDGGRDGEMVEGGVVGDDGGGGDGGG